MEAFTMHKINQETIAEAISNPEFSFIETFADAGDPAKVTREMTTLIFKHRKIREQLKIRERERVVLENKYEIKRRNSYIKHNESSTATEKAKSVLVEIDTEDEKYNLAIIDQKIRELSRDMTSIKLEIDTWKAISYSLRTEMGSF